MSASIRKCPKRNRINTSFNTPEPRKKTLPFHWKTRYLGRSKSLPMILLVPPSLNWGHGSLPTPHTLLCFCSAHLKDPPTTHHSKTTRKPLVNLASLKLAASLTPENGAKTTQKKGNTSYFCIFWPTWNSSDEICKMLASLEPGTYSC